MHTLRGRHRGGGKKRGVESLTNDTPSQKGVLDPPPRTVRFPPPHQVSALFCLYKNRRQSRPEAPFGGVQNFPGERVLWYVFLPPYVLHPPISRPNTHLPQKCFQSTQQAELSVLSDDLEKTAFASFPSECQRLLPMIFPPHYGPTVKLGRLARAKSSAFQIRRET